MLFQEQITQQVKKDSEDSLLRSFDNGGMLNERKCKALVDVSAPGLVVDGVFVMFSCEFCHNAELTRVTNLKFGAACRS